MRIPRLGSYQCSALASKLAFALGWRIIYARSALIEDLAVGPRMFRWMVGTLMIPGYVVLAMDVLAGPIPTTWAYAILGDILVWGIINFVMLTAMVAQGLRGQLARLGRGEHG